MAETVEVYREEGGPIMVPKARLEHYLGLGYKKAPPPRAPKPKVLEAVAAEAEPDAVASEPDPPEDEG